MNKTLILLGAGNENLAVIEHAKDLGFRVLATDKNPQAPGAALADEFLPLCAYTPAESVAGLLRWQAEGGVPGGVLAVALDAPHTVAAVGKALNLPTITEETAALATDKLAMKERLQSRGIPVPWFAALRDVQDLRLALKDRGYPLILKPMDSRGARAVMLLRPGIDLDWAFAAARQESPTQRVMIEEYLDGPQVSTEGLMIGGIACIPGFADRNYEFLERFAPNIIENGGDMPSLLPEHAQKALRELTGQAALALGLEHGPVKGDLVWHQNSAYVIEIAARHSGGYFITHEIPWNTGVDLLGASISMAMGEKIDPAALEPKQQQGVCQRYLFPAPGLVREISGQEAARQIPGVRYVEVRVSVGDIIPPTVNHPSRAGVVMAVGRDRPAAQSAALQAARTIKIITTPA